MIDQPERTSAVFLDGKELPWYSVWYRVLAGPRVGTFEEVLRGTAVTRGRAYRWVFVGGLGIAPFAGAPFLPNIIQNDWIPAELQTYFAYLSWMLTISMFLVFAFAMGSFMTQIVARFLGGRGALEQLMVAFGAFLAPIGLACGVLVVVPFASFVIAGLIIYAVFLSVVAVKAVHGLSWGKVVFSNTAVFVFASGGIYLWARGVAQALS
jgi:hypothetical protein